MTMLRANLASKSGRSGRIRTPDRRFWRPLLFHLSYTPMKQTFIKLALNWRYFIFLPFAPGGSTSSNNAITPSCMPSIIWEYVSIVKTTELCPRASEITLGFAPRRRARLAKVYLRSWKRTPSRRAFSLCLFIVSFLP